MKRKRTACFSAAELDELKQLAVFADDSMAGDRKSAPYQPAGPDDVSATSLSNVDLSSEFSTFQSETTVA